MSKHRSTRPGGAGAFAIALAFGVAAALHAAGARANGAFPDSQSIMTPDARPHAIRLATNFGILSSDDDGQTWVWSCEQPETNNGSLYQMGPAPRNRIFVISSEGLAFSDTDSCGWSLAGGTAAGAGVLDAFPDPSNVNRVLAVAAVTHDGGAAATYTVIESSDGGTTFGPTRYTAASGDNITGVEIARSAPSTVYVAMTSGATFAPKLARSTDGGSTWKTEDLSAKLPTKTTLIRIVAVDPTNADRVYLRIHSQAGDAFALAVAGASGFTVTTPQAFPGGILTAYARLASGTIVISGVVGVDQVAYKSGDAGASFQPLPTPPSVRAMSSRGSTLFVVADNVADGYAVGTSVDQGQSWQPLMNYDQVTAIQSCVHQSCQDDCLVRAGAGQWTEDFCAATAPAPHDAGGEPPDAGPGVDASLPTGAAGAAGAAGAGGSGGAGGASLTPGGKSGCACAVDEPGAPVAVPFTAALFVLLVRRRRRADPSP